MGKSTLLCNLAGVYSEVAAYEFTTLTTVPGVIRYKVGEFYFSKFWSSLLGSQNPTTWFAWNHRRSEGRKGSRQASHCWWALGLLFEIWRKVDFEKKLAKNRLIFVFFSNFPGLLYFSVARTCSLILMVLDVMKPLQHKRLLEYELEGFGNWFLLDFCMCRRFSFL